MGRVDESGRDALIYVAIALIVVGILAGVTIYTADHDIDIHRVTPWLGFGIVTASLLVYFIVRFRKRWKSPGLWLVLGPFAATHVVVGTHLVSTLPPQHDSVPWTIGSLIAFVEAAFVRAVLDKVLGVKKAAKSDTNGSRAITP